MGSCKRFVDYLVIVFLNNAIRQSFFPFCLEDEGKGTPDLFTLHVVCPVVQNLDFCLIGRKTKDPSEPYTHRSRNISDIRSY